MWLRDTLPTAFPNMRVMLYGYDTQLIQSESFQTIPNLASSLLHQLHAFGFFEPSAVPIIFIAHSLGGIVVKETLSQIANLSDVEEGDQMFLSKVKQVVFFGVPHQGMMISHLLPMVKGQPNEAIIHALSVNSPYLRSLDEQFLGLTLTREFDVISVYETHKSQTPQVRGPTNHCMLISLRIDFRCWRTGPGNVRVHGRFSSNLNRLYSAVRGAPKYLRSIKITRTLLSFQRLTPASELWFVSFER